MGCSSSTPAQAATPQLPSLLGRRPSDCGKGKKKQLARTLTVVDTNKMGPAKPRMRLTEAEQKWMSADLPDSLQDGSWVIGSQTDEDLNKRPAFGAKDLSQSGNVDTVGLGYACHKGKKPEIPNQDAWIALRVSDRHSIYGVFDGHGEDGHHVAQFVKEKLPAVLVADDRFAQSIEMSNLLRESFEKVQALITLADRKGIFSADVSGTTTTIVVHDRDTQKLWIAHLGDSGVCLARRVDDNIEGAALTRDHTPELEDEKERLEKAGGEVKIVDGVARVVAKGKTVPGLNMTRCHGDLLGHSKAGLTCQPEVCEWDLTSADLAMIVCSDGVWEYMGPQEAAEVVMSFNRDEAGHAAARLAKMGYDNWMLESKKLGCGEVSDDIAVVVVHLQ